MRSFLSRRLLALIMIGIVCGGGPWTSAQGLRKQRNPLGNLFRALDRGIREGAEELEREKTGRDQLDIRPVQRPEDHRRLQQAADLIKQARWHDAVEILQYLLDQPSDAFSMTESREVLSLQSEVDRMIGELPEEGQRSYQNRFAATADRLFAEARQTQDEALLLAVATRYFHTASGRAALELLARDWCDEGDFGRSAQAWLRLAKSASGAELTRTGTAAATMLARSGRKEEARNLAKSLPGAERLLGEIDRLPPQGPEERSRFGPFLPHEGIHTTSARLDPVLVPGWTAELIERYTVREQLDLLTADLLEQGRALVPTIQPLIADGKLALRTLRGLQVRDVATGRLLWERRKHQSPEELLTRPRTPGDLDGDISPLRQTQEALFEHHQLTSLIYRDGVYAGLSSDGRRLYGIESTGEASMMSPIHVWQRTSGSQSEVVAWETNELTAWDLATGTVLWRIGGAAIEAEFSRPLAGTYFFGPPVPEGPDLYVLGERAGEVSLFCLAAQTGEELWSQPLAMPGRPIAEDTVRRYWPCQPVLAEGMIICPTTCGWLAAVDRSTRRLKWASRFSPRLDQHRQFRGGYAVQSLQELNRRWLDAPPLVNDGRVLFTPPEIPDEFGISQPALYCFDVQSGQLLWEQPKGDGATGTALYLAGIWKGQAIIVGNTNVLARRLTGRGDIQWNVTLPGRPSGRGILVNNQFVLPLDGNLLVIVNLEQGDIEKAIPLAAGEARLGNLALSGELLVSASYQSAWAFPCGDDPVHQGTSPESIVRAGLSEVRLLLNAQKLAEAVAKLQNLRLAAPSALPELVAEIEQVEWTALSQLVLAHPNQADQTLQRLKALVHSPEQSRAFRRLHADHLLASGDWPQAVSEYLEVLLDSPPEERVSEGSREVRVDGWVGARLAKIDSGLAQAADRTAFAQHLQNALERMAADPRTRDRWARALLFHPLGQQLELQLAGEARQAGELAAAILRLQRVSQRTGSPLQAEALARLGDLLSEQGWLQDAAECWRQMAGLASLPLSDGRLSEVAAREGLQSIQANLEAGEDSQKIWDGAWTIERVGVAGDETGLLPVPQIGHGLQWLQSLRFLLESDSQRLRVESRRRGEYLGSFPLRSLPALEHNPNAAIRLSGPFAYAVHRGVIHALAWPDSQIKWTWSPDLRGAALGRLAPVYSSIHRTMLPVSQFSASRQSLSYRNQTGFLLVAGPRALLLLCRDLIALDPLTGEELWRDRQVTERLQAFSLSPDWLFVAANHEPSARSVLDGRPREDDPPQEAYRRMLEVEGEEVVVLDRGLPGPQQSASVQLRRLSSNGQALWSVDIPVSALLGQPDARRFFWLSVDKELSMVNLRTGQVMNLGKVAEKQENQKSQVSLLSDGARYFVFVDEGDTQPVYVNLPAIRFAGRILAFDSEGQALWSQTTPLMLPSATKKWPLNVLSQDFEESPVLLLVGDVPDRKADLYFHRLRVLALDKQTGEAVVDWERPSESGNFSFLHVDPERRCIELRTYNERLQLRPQAHSEKSEPRL